MTTKTAMITVDIPEQLADVIEELWPSCGEMRNDKVTEGLSLLVKNLPVLDFSAEWQASHPKTMAWIVEINR